MIGTILINESGVVFIEADVPDKVFEPFNDLERVVWRVDGKVVILMKIEDNIVLGYN